jgi:hypothetical protein
MEQAIDRHENRIRDLQSYLDVRRHTIAMTSLYALLQLGLDIPEEVISHPTIETMVISSSDMIIIDNVSDFSADNTLIIHKKCMTGHCILQFGASTWRC